MKLNKINIRNILGIESLEIKPGQVTVISGQNGTGKTSVLEAIKSVFAGGSDATLLKKGAESGEVVLLFDDGVEATKKVGPTKSTVSVESPKFGSVKKAQTYLSGLVDSLGLNPVEFLTAPGKQRTQMLLESMPIKVNSDELEPIIGRTASEGELDDPLSLIAHERQRFYDERTGVNRTAKDKRATIEQMKTTLPAGQEATDWAAEVEGLEQTVNAVRVNLQNALDLKRADVLKKKMDLSVGSQSRVDEVKRKLEDQISLLRTNTDKDIAKIQKEFNDKRDAIEGESQVEINEIQIKHQPHITRVEGELAVARENLSNQSKINQTKTYIDTLLSEAKSAETKSEICTSTIEMLDALKLKLLSKLPIKGVEIRDGQIYVNDIVFDRLNESQKVGLAIDIAKLRAGSLELIIVDGMERLDSKTFAQLEKAMKKESAQFILTRVSDGAFSVEAQ